MILRSRHLALLAAALAALSGGCGKDKEGKPIPAAQATALQKELDAVERRLDFAKTAPAAQAEGACRDIQDQSLPAVQQTLDQIPASVNGDVRNAVRDSFDRLFELTARQCTSQGGPTKTTPTTPETNTETTPTETQTETTTTETAPTETTTNEKPGKGPKKPKEPKGPKGGGGVGIPPGQGGGAGGEGD